MLLLVTNQLWQISFFQPIWNNFSDGLTLRLRVLQVKIFFQIWAQDNIDKNDF